MDIKGALDLINSAQTESEKNEHILVFLDQMSFVIEKIETPNSRIDGNLNYLYDRIRSVRQDINLEMGPLTII
jgi:prefoldin subunit 5